MIAANFYVMPIAAVMFETREFEGAGTLDSKRTTVVMRCHKAKL